MKRILFLLLVSLSVFGQDIIVLKHTNYVSHFSKQKKYPVMVQWELDESMVNCPNPLKRKDNFKPDPLDVDDTNLGNDYNKSGYDRGHLMPADYNQCQGQGISDECFYFSNMMPQTHDLNAGDWKTLEQATKNWTHLVGKVIVWAGGIGEIKKIGRVSVPEKCYKVIYAPTTGTWKCYLFNNDTNNRDGYQNNLVDKETIEKITGLKFAL